MQTDLVAMRAAKLSRSGCDTATTLSRPSASQARTIRTAISPRLATSTRPNGNATLLPARRSTLDDDERLVELDQGGVLVKDSRHHAVHPCPDAVEELHHLDQAHRIAGTHPLPQLDIGRFAGGGRT